MKRVAALFLSFAMILTIVGALPIVVSAEENTGDIIFEDFGDGFVIDKDNNKITTTSGLTVIANEEFFTKNIKVKGGKSVYEGSSITDSGLVIPALESNETTRALIFAFDKVQTGKVNISFDIMANSKQYSHAGSYGSVAQLNDDGTYTTKMSNKIYNLDAISEALVLGNGGNSGYKVVAKNLNEYKRITHCVDMDEKTVTSYVNGELLMSQSFTADYINALVFEDNYNWGVETIDNLAVVKNPESHMKTVNFYNGSELISTKQVEAGTSIAEADFPVVSKEGYYLNGYSRTNGGVAENISGFPIMEDTNLYASFVSSIIYEDFESTGFTVDKSNERITTTSGLSFDMRGDGYYIPAMSVKDGAMAVEQTTAGAPNGNYDNYLNINFGKINSGKARVSFKFRVSNYAGWGNANSYFGNINDESGYALAAGTNYKLGFVKDHYRTNVNNATTAPAVLTEDNDTSWHTVTYDIDKDAGTYTFSWDGANQGSYDLIGANLSKLRFYTYTYGSNNSNVYNYYIDDVVVIRDVDKNIAQKVRFIDGDTVVTEKSVNFMEKLAASDIPKGLGKENYRFVGWSSVKGSAIAEDLTSITIKTATDFYAVYEKSVLYEDFTSTGFSINKEAKTISSDSGFTFSAPETVAGSPSYLFDSMSIKEGALSVNHSSITASGSNNDLLEIGFNDITEGTATLSFRYRIDKITAWGNGSATIGRIADKDNYRLYTTNNKSGYTNGNVGTAAPQLLTSTISAWHTVEYNIDKDKNTYYFVFDGTSYGPYNLKEEALSSINFDTRNHQNSNVFNYTIDDIKLIKNPVTLTFTDAISGEVLATTVVSKDSYARIPNLVGLTLSTDIDLTCVESDMTVPCTVTASGDAYVENFEDFTIDYTNKTVTTSSNFTGVSLGSAVSSETQIVEDNSRGSKVLQVDWDNSQQTFSYNFPKATKGTVKVSFAISVLQGAKADSPDFAKLASLADSSTNKYAVRMGYPTYYAYISTYVNNYIFFNGTEYVKLGIGDSAWHNVTYYADLDNKSYYAEIDNKTFGPYNFNSSDIDGVDSIFFGGNRDGWEGKYQLDDLKVEVIPTSNPSDTISGNYNGYGKTIVLNNKGITAEAGTVISNTSFVAKNGSYVKIGETKLSGMLVFNENGELDVPIDATAKLENGTNSGFLHKAVLGGTETGYTVTLRATGTLNGTEIDKTADVTFDFKGIPVKGNTLFKLIVQDVPTGVSVDTVE